jgi:hypothetical protein
MRLRNRGRAVGIALLVVGLGALAACGSSGKSSSSSPNSSANAHPCAGVTVASPAERGQATTGTLPLQPPQQTPPVTSAQNGPSTYAPWPAPPNPMQQACKAGLVPETAERLEFHVHAHLDVYIDGKPVLVPAGLGIDTKNPGVHLFNTNGMAAYGGISPPCDTPCISPLHTHDVTGILHTESATRKYNTLGQLFIEWNVRLTPTCVATYCGPKTPVVLYVDGAKFTGDPRTIPLSNLRQITVVIGTPPAQIPNTAAWDQLI